uniref:EF-hand domain-containing protein n=1 Tax=Neobodo designis TaxID=312471 RepID=A0A7S1KY38_NEODS
MGAYVSRNTSLSDNSPDEHEIAAVVAHTAWEEADVREYHAAFKAQYPSGLIDRSTFINENMATNGGPAELWAHVYKLIGGTHPLSAGTSSTFVAADTAFDDVEDPHGSNTAPASPPGGIVAAPKRRKTSSDSDDDSDDDDDDDDALPNARLRKERDREALQRENDITTQSRLKTSYIASLAAADMGREPEGMSFSHVMIRLHRAHYAPAEKKLKYLFALIDQDNDGVIGEGDVARLLAWMYDLKSVQNLESFQRIPEEQRKDTRLRARAVLTLLDRDHDLLLTQDEFLESCRMDNSLLDMLTVLRIG